MARGWESKSVEDQIREKQTEADKPNQILTAEEAALKSKLEGLLLARSRALKDLENAHDARYRALLERTLAYLDQEIARLSA